MEKNTEYIIRFNVETHSKTHSILSQKQTSSETPVRKIFIQCGILHSVYLTYIMIYTRIIRKYEYNQP